MAQVSRIQNGGVHLLLVYHNRQTLKSGRFIAVLCAQLLVICLAGFPGILFWQLIFFDIEKFTLPVFGERRDIHSKI